VSTLFFFRRRVLLKAMGIFQRQDVGEGN